jgi:hypothetical protein
MAFSLEDARQEIQTSIHGRRFGLDDSDYVVGPKDIRSAVQDVTTVPTTVNGYGTVRVAVTGSSQGPVQHFLPTPKPGNTVTLVNASSSTGSHQFLSTANGAAIVGGTIGTTRGVVNLVDAGASVTLRGLSSALWGIISQVGSTNSSST